jgi:hypothetical protein
MGAKEAQGIIEEFSKLGIFLCSFLDLLAQLHPHPAGRTRTPFLGTLVSLESDELSEALAQATSLVSSALSR